MSDERAPPQTPASHAGGQQKEQPGDVWVDSGRARRRRLQRSGFATLAIALVSGGFAYTLASLVQPTQSLPENGGVRLAQELAEQRQRALRDYLNDELADLASWASLPGSSQAGLAANLRRVSATGLLAGRSVGRLANAPPTPPTAYEKLYGRAARYTQAAHAPLAASASHASGSATAGKELIRGVMLQARLANELASNPAHGAAIATLTAAAKLGETLLPSGTQLHGAVRGSGNSDTRVFVDFSFARLANGDTLPMAATAADRQGREGIPGKKSLTRAAAGSVGLAAAARAGQVAGQTLAGGLGSILGAGVEGATASGGDKAMRLDHDDYVVLVARGTPIRIYVHEFMPPGS